MNAVADKLRKARALIERGWCTQALSVPLWINGEEFRLYCAEGALAVHAGNSDALQLFRTAIGADSVHAWNDAPERTQAEVLAAFDKAIELASQESAK